MVFPITAAATGRLRGISPPFVVVRGVGGCDAGVILWKVITYHHSFINWAFLVSR